MTFANQVKNTLLQDISDMRKCLGFSQNILILIFPENVNSTSSRLSIFSSVWKPVPSGMNY